MERGLPVNMSRETAEKSKRLSSGTSVSTSFSSSAYKVGSNDDLLSEILVRLPVRSIIRSKSVSKHWLSLITDRRFSVQFYNHNPNPSPPSGLLFQRFFNDYKSEYEFVPFDVNNPVKAPFKAIKFQPDALDTSVLKACNGLMLCQGSFQKKSEYYIYNPTTKQVFTLPDADWSSVSICGMDFVFDPSRSPHYKVLCVRGLRAPDMKSEYYTTVIEIYSSETGKWRVSGEPFRFQCGTSYFRGVYFCDAIHWYDNERFVWCYKFNEERFHQIPVPPLRDVLGGIDAHPRHLLLESRGCMLLIDVFPDSSEFDIYEMHNDYSGWFVKYHVDIRQIAQAFPEMVQRRGLFKFGILSVVLAEMEDDSFVVLELPGKAIRFNLLSKTFHKLCDVIDESIDEYSLWDHDGLDFIESLFEVS